VNVKPQIENCLYVDDSITDKGTVQQGIELFHTAKHIMNQVEIQFRITTARKNQGIKAILKSQKPFSEKEESIHVNHVQACRIL